MIQEILSLPAAMILGPMRSSRTLSPMPRSRNTNRTEIQGKHGHVWTHCTPLWFPELRKLMIGPHFWTEPLVTGFTGSQCSRPVLVGFESVLSAGPSRSSVCDLGDVPMSVVRISSQPSGELGFGELRGCDLVRLPAAGSGAAGAAPPTRPDLKATSPQFAEWLARRHMSSDLAIERVHLPADGRAGRLDSSVGSRSSFRLRSGVIEPLDFSPDDLPFKVFVGECHVGSVGAHQARARRGASPGLDVGRQPDLHERISVPLNVPQKLFLDQARSDYETFRLLSRRTVCHRLHYLADVHGETGQGLLLAPRPLPRLRASQVRTLPARPGILPDCRLPPDVRLQGPAAVQQPEDRDPRPRYTHPGTGATMAILARIRNTRGHRTCRQRALWSTPSWNGRTGAIR